ncbi:hypothetical protein [Candidatus Laterigemmans baculatus]|uniref:hypothetical protein n=1 Tax=Candidatus Laterigemmans baculatus TaxID=2770505 RepID=UPI0013DB4AA7|nr:hypothetical protein [Candidatus Laterigemmans baculatus]
MSATFQPDATPPAKSTSGLKIVLIVLAVLALIGLLICGGFAALIYFGWNQAQTAMGEEFKRQLQGNPVIEQELGEIESMSVSLVETAQRNENNTGTPVMVLHVDGSQADGVLLVETSPQGNNQIISATLETEDGRSIPVPIENTGDDGVFDASDIDAGEPVEVEPIEVEEPQVEGAEAEEAVEAR